MNKLIKHIDFTKMNALDHRDWNIQVGDKWANNELQHYVNDAKNIFFTDEGLVIRATSENGVYESARINTRDKFFFQYGRIEITAKMPKGKGTWPALWMLSQENRYGHWPKSGEIDIMEYVGRNDDRVFLCLHSETYNHRNKEQFYFETEVKNLSSEFHVFAIEWTKDFIRYFIDNKAMHVYHKTDKPDQSHKGWPFDQPYFLIMNLAVGGKFGGPVDDTIFPADFIIKEIKVFQ